MYCRIEHYEKYEDIVAKTYTSSFPVSEQFPFAILKRCDTEPNVHLSVILLNKIPVGMQFTVDLPNDITYLMYYAVIEEYRCRGVGSNVLKGLVQSNKRVMLCIERPVDKLTQRRKKFYIRNGFYETGVFFEDMGVQYEVLISCKDYMPTTQDLLNRYKCMTNDRNFWFEIKDYFNVDHINYV